jgi:predicted methyltransferase
MSRVRTVLSAALLFLLFGTVFGAEWLPATASCALSSQVPAGEGADRDSWQQPEKVLDAVGVRAGMTIGEVGSGYGYFTFNLAARV